LAVTEPKIIHTMKTLMLLGILLFSFAFCGNAQGEGDVWMADDSPFGGSNYGLRFNASMPEVFYYDTSSTALTGIKASQSVCDAVGNPLFFTGGTSCKVYDRAGNVMPNGYGLQYPTPGTTYSLAPLICPHPGNTNQYFVIYQKNGALLYSIVDMSLNGGMGDVVSKNTSINAFAGSEALATTSKLILVQGCSSIWLVVRSRNAGQFRSYEISATGLNTTPVISETGQFPFNWYNGDVISGRLKASPDGKKLVATISKFYDAVGSPFAAPKGGIELFDFEKCSGKVKKSIVIDSTQNFDGVAFSPDASKLYASSDTSVYQYDLSAGSPTAVLATKTWMLSSPLIPVWIPFCYCDTTQMTIGDLKLASNGKIYMGNNTGSCVSCLPIAATAKYHSIEQPNMAGMAAMPVVDVISFPLGYITGADLPPDIVLAPAPPDTVVNSYTVTACFSDTAVLFADSTGSCFLWQDGKDSSAYKAGHSGTYFVRYFGTDCSYHIDTFHLQMIPLPNIVQAGYSCPDAYQGTAVVLGNDSFDYNFQWLDGEGGLLRSASGYTDTGRSLNVGTNYLKITTNSGCDTTISFEVQPLPVTQASFESDTIVCKGKVLNFYSTSSAPLQQWFFGDGATESNKNVSHIYNSSGEYDAVLQVTNIEGCKDTAVKRIYVKELLLQLSASDTLVEKNALVQLYAFAPEPFTITGWGPVEYFGSSLGNSQQLNVQKTEIFYVSGVSDKYGCEATTSVKVTVEPFMQIPNAFSPNGDGLNDYFTPVITGDGYVLQSFLIFNRWGQCVYEAYLSKGLKGWDGTFNGKPLDIGTYFYQIVINNPSGKQLMRKGEINLIR
jgi:gliding motility-associated-like protein